MRQKKSYRLSRSGHLLALRVAVIGNDGSAIVLRLLLDTGSSYTIMPVEVAERIGCDTHHPLRTARIVAANGIIVAPIVKVPRFNCLGLEIKDFPVVAHTLPAGTFVDGLLGMDFLEGFGALIDVSRATIWIRKQAAQARRPITRPREKL